MISARRSPLAVCRAAPSIVFGVVEVVGGKTMQQCPDTHSDATWRSWPRGACGAVAAEALRQIAAASPLRACPSGLRTANNSRISRQTRAQAAGRRAETRKSRLVLRIFNA
jgi:hypothetical protein